MFTLKSRRFVSASTPMRLFARVDATFCAGGAHAHVPPGEVVTFIVETGSNITMNKDAPQSGHGATGMVGLIALFRVGLNFFTLLLRTCYSYSFLSRGVLLKYCIFSVHVTSP